MTTLIHVGAFGHEIWESIERDGPHYTVYGFYKDDAPRECASLDMAYACVAASEPSPAVAEFQQLLTELERDLL